MTSGRGNFTPTHMISFDSCEYPIPAVIMYQSNETVVWKDNLGREDFAYCDDVTISEYKSPEEVLRNKLLSTWKRKGLDWAHDNENSTSTLKAVFEWLIEKDLINKEVLDD